MPAEYIIRRKGKVPALNWEHPRLTGISAKQIESAALKKEPTLIDVDKIVAIGNHLADHFGEKWRPLTMDEVPEELHEKHAQVLEKHSGMHRALREAGVLAKEYLKTLAFKNLHVRAVELPDGTYAVVGGAYRASWAKIFGTKKLSARVVKLEEL